MVTDTTPSKRGRPKKVAICLDDRYPALNLNGDITEEEERTSYTALTKEMKSPKPRKDLYLPLMKKTFVMRRQYILHHASSVKHIVQEYPALKDATVVSNMNVTGCVIILLCYFNLRLSRKWSWF